MENFDKSNFWEIYRLSLISVLFFFFNLEFQLRMGVHKSSLKTDAHSCNIKPYLKSELFLGQLLVYGLKIKNK